MKLEDSEIPFLLRDLLTECLSVKDSLSAEAARMHLHMGFFRRVSMIRSSWSAIYNLVNGADGENLDPYSAGDLNLHLNSLYMHLRGSLDNLAWAIVYEFQTFPNAREDGGRERFYCDLFHDKFLNAIEPMMPNLLQVIRQKDAWRGELANLRDPIAHRIPIYAVPGIATEKEAAEIASLQAQGTEAIKSGDTEGAPFRWTG